jgi:hypothetical protein
MTLPQLKREPIRPELEGDGADKEIWQPRWKCFCCHDNGLVELRLIELVIPDYNHHLDKPVICQNFRCEAGEIYRGDFNYDQRFTGGICAELDRKNRDDWRRTIESQFERIQNSVKDTAREMSFKRTQRSRTRSEEEIAKKRHEYACNADPQKLRSLARAYLGDEFMRDGAS